MVKMAFITEAGYLGEQLIKMGTVTNDQTKHALEVQAQKKNAGQSLKLGQVLISLGYCTEEDIGR